MRAITVTGAPSGRLGRPFSSSIVDLGSFGYEEAEYFVSGMATPFAPRPGTDLGGDGRWDVVAGDPVPYTTRILVRRPPAERCNGTVVVEFMQEYFGTERDTYFRWSAETLLREGFVWVGASLHHEGIDVRGREEIRYGDVVFQTGPSLAEWDPDRYGELHFPSSDLCYDALSQIGGAVGPERDRSGIDPLNGLEVRRVFAAGNTIAAARLRVYIDAVHPRQRVFAGFYLQDLNETSLPLADGVEAPTPLQLRTDVDVPVIVLNTTTAAAELALQSDAPNLRVWEPAGSSHTTGAFMVRTAEATKRDVDVDTPVCPPDYANTLPMQYVCGAALVALHRWAADGTPAPAFPRIDRTGPGGDDGGGIAFDAVGNVVGGLRTPWVDVPIARYDWRGECLGGAGRTFPFEASQLTELYGDPQTYQQQFAAAAHAAEIRGALLAHDAAEAIDESRKVSW